MVSLYIDWKTLEKEVDKAIEKKDVLLINFDSKTVKECRYIQKYIETFPNLDDALSITIFLGGIGIASLYQFYSTDSFFRYIFVVLGIVFAYYTLKFLSKIMKFKNNKSMHRDIILNAEKRILSEGDIEPTPPEETTNISSQTQENPQPKSQSMGQTEYIKATLDLQKILISALFVGIVGLGAYYFQSQKPNVIIVLGAIIILSVPFFMGLKQFRKTMEKLKDMP